MVRVVSGRVIKEVYSEVVERIDLCDVVSMLLMVSEDDDVVLDGMDEELVVELCLEEEWEVELGMLLE